MTPAAPNETLSEVIRLLGEHAGIERLEEVESNPDTDDARRCDT